MITCDLSLNGNELIDKRQYDKVPQVGHFIDLEDDDSQYEVTGVYRFCPGHYQITIEEINEHSV